MSSTPTKKKATPSPNSGSKAKAKAKASPVHVQVQVQVRPIKSDFEINEFAVVSQQTETIKTGFRAFVSAADALCFRVFAGDFVRIGSKTGEVWIGLGQDRGNVVCVQVESLVLRPTTQGLDSLWIDESLQLLAKEYLRDMKYVEADGLVEFPYNGISRQFRVESITLHDHSSPISEINAESTMLKVLPYATESGSQQKKKWGAHEKVSYDSIGGLKKQMDIVRKLVEVPLLDPQRFARYGIRPPRGVLLYGPPGTGKTLIARAVASETGAHVIIINGPEIISKFYGETEERLRSIFQEAQENAPSLIFIDEIDSLCPKRDDNATDLEKRIVATLLTLLDGTDSKTNTADGVVVLAATNRPNSLDDALRRPGRFDREVEIGIPDASDRTAILTALLRNTPHSLTESEVSGIAGAAHGYVGADLAGVVREAGMRCLKRVTTVGGDVAITVQDLEAGLGVVKPSSMREVSLEVPNEDVKQRIREAVEWPLKHPEAFERFKIRPPKGILIKTLMAKALATEAGLNFLAVKGPELFSKWVGESEKAIRDIFKKARAASPSVIFFDEIDAIAVRRGNDNGSVSDRVLSQLLNEMDGIEALVNVTVIAATNRPDILDSALLRPGRMDRILYVSPPDYESRLKIFTIKTEKMACAEDVDCSELARLTEGYSGAEVVSVCQEAAMYAMEEDVNIEAVSRRHFVDAIGGVTPRITKEMIDFYDRFRQQSGLRSI
ncbi:AAA-domain-containing protein [Rhizoclosmatium globosum]|uniref:AAA-domain-containing protein n=1 Tax=Rhizoclosmatium globosum TaxID=329046 RepID=A0A1Y2CDH4_9FUNG|nr:AAA-domain-containing protein [Rhizoclosmatium globosum]|eukprot:ORY45099.1 AAA-domain-containing protein [Rhizoclosmatium globosum]